MYTLLWRESYGSHKTDDGIVLYETLEAVYAWMEHLTEESPTIELMYETLEEFLEAVSSNNLGTYHSSMDVASRPLMRLELIHCVPAKTLRREEDS